MRPRGVETTERKSDALQGTLDLMVLKTLDAMGPPHGYGIAKRTEQISTDVLRVNQGNNRKAKFYFITKTGRKQLAAEAANWERVSAVIVCLLRLDSTG
jgi:DNA-binding PadR family transcriptional regulator